MLEIADRGFGEVSKQIDNYIDSVDEKSESGDFNVEINSISLERFAEFWSGNENLEIQNTHISR